MPLMWAARGGFLDVAHLLLRGGRGAARSRRRGAQLNLGERQRVVAVLVLERGICPEGQRALLQHTGLESPELGGIRVAFR